MVSNSRPPVSVSVPHGAHCREAVLRRRYERYWAFPTISQSIISFRSAILMNKKWRVLQPLVLPGNEGPDVAPLIAWYTGAGMM